MVAITLRKRKGIIKTHSLPDLPPDPDDFSTIFMTAHRVSETHTRSIIGISALQGFICSPNLLFW
jgi:hypothetical protein